MNKWFQLAVYSLIGLIITSFALSLLQNNAGYQNNSAIYYYGPGTMGHQRVHMGLDY